MLYWDRFIYCIAVFSLKAATPKLIALLGSHFVWCDTRHIFHITSVSLDLWKKWHVWKCVFPMTNIYLWYKYSINHCEHHVQRFISFFFFLRYTVSFPLISRCLSTSTETLLLECVCDYGCQYTGPLLFAVFYFWSRWTCKWLISKIEMIFSLTSHITQPHCFPSPSALFRP